MIRDQAPDAVVTDFHFFWNSAVADELGVPCVMFCVIGCFSSLAMRLLVGAVRDGEDDKEVAVPGFNEPEIRIPVAELPEFLRCPTQQKQEDGPSQ